MNQKLCCAFSGPLQSSPFLALIMLMHCSQLPESVKGIRQGHYKQGFAWDELYHIGAIRWEPTSVVKTTWLLKLANINCCLTA